MKKTRIAFDDIKAGDMLEVVVVDGGAKQVITGIAYTLEEINAEWQDAHIFWSTSEGSLLAAKGEELATIYRIDVAEVKFEDIRKGDRIRVTTVNYAGRVDIVEDTVETLITGMNSFWLNKGHNTVIFEKTYLDEGESRTIEILEREGE